MRTLKARVERALPEQRLFLKSDAETRFVRLSPNAQLLALVGSAAIVGWAIVASAVLLMNAIGSGNYREQAVRSHRTYEERLNTLSAERAARAEEALMAQQRFVVALAEVSEMQARLLASENRRRELEKGIDVIQATLRRTIKERDTARGESRLLSARLEEGNAPLDAELDRLRDIEDTVDFLSAALGDTAGERDSTMSNIAAANAMIEELELEFKLTEERNDRIFQQLEEAVAVSLTPLDEMFRAAGLPSDSIIETLRRSYSGQGGPIVPLTMSTKGQAPDADSLRANGIMQRLDQLNLYRMAVQKTPFAEPVKSAFRFTSGYGHRRDPKTGGTRMHEGTDFASATGTPIYATADGVVTHAGWQSGYGRLIKIKHEFGIETRYAHLNKISVNVGERVSRGDRIGDMGNSGRSTGTHLHYEVRIGGESVNPMKFIKAARDVF